MLPPSCAAKRELVVSGALATPRTPELKGIAWDCCCKHSEYAARGAADISGSSSLKLLSESLRLQSERR